MSARLTPRFDRALAFASELHRDQLRKGTQVPYVSHLLAVAAIAIEHGASEDEAVAALLHDAIEDQSESHGGAAKMRADIQSRFGDEVLAIVEGCTDADTVPKPPWEARKKEHLKRLKSASRSVLLVTAADKLHNARSIASELLAEGDAVWKRFNGGKNGTLGYYRAVCDVLLDRMPGRLSEELARAFLAMNALAGKPSDTSTQTGA